MWNQSTRFNDGILAVNITVFDLERGKRRCFIDFLVYDLVYLIIDANLVTLSTLIPLSDSVCTQTCSPFLRIPIFS